MITNFNQTKFALFLAVENNKIEIVQLLLANPKININLKSISYDKKNEEKKFKTSFHLAIEKYYQDIISIFQDHNSEINITE